MRSLLLACLALSTLEGPGRLPSSTSMGCVGIVTEGGVTYEVSSLAYAARKSHTVVLATVLAFKAPLPGEFSAIQPVLLQVDEVFKGPARDSLVVFTQPGDFDGYDIRIADRHIVYADPDSTGQLWTSSCTRTRPLAEATEDTTFWRRAR